MKTYVLFNKNTGDIVHTHTEVALSGDHRPVSIEDLIATYRPPSRRQIDPADLDVLEVDPDQLQRGLSNRKHLYVDVQKRILMERQMAPYDEIRKESGGESRQPQEIPTIPRTTKIKRPLVFVPGIMGSTIRLKQSVGPDSPLWPPVELGRPGFLMGLRQNVDKVVGGDMPLMPFAYDPLIWFLNKLGYTVADKTLGIFGYDWSESNEDSGLKLRNYIEKVIREFNDYYHPNPPCKAVDVVNHSMGGLVTRAAHRLNNARIDRAVYIASPHYGAPKAFFVLHPEIKTKFNVFGDILSKFIAEAAWRFLKTPGDYKSLDEAFKDIAPTCPSVWELMPDWYYLTAARFMVYEDESALTQNIPVIGVHDTYGHEYLAGQGEPWHFPLGYSGLIRNAMDFKLRLGNALPGNRNLVIYCGSLATTDEVVYDNVAPSKGFETPTASNQLGDETVPTDSASLGRLSVAEEVVDTHSGLPNNQYTLEKIKFFLSQ
jgi:pimeloyl-ACP methyl ester carboxylesterase